MTRRRIYTAKTPTAYIALLVRRSWRLLGAIERWIWDEVGPLASRLALEASIFAFIAFALVAILK